MSQEDRSTSLAASQREDQFEFADQRSCRCVNSPNEAGASTRCLEAEQQVCLEVSPGFKDAPLVDNERVPLNDGGKHRHHETRNRNNEINNEITGGPQITDNNRTITGLRYTMDGDNTDNFSRGERERASTPASKNYRESNVLEKESPDVDFLVSQVEQKLHQQQMLEQRLRDSTRRISPARAARSQLILDTENFSQFEMDDDRDIEERETIDPRQLSSSPGRTNDERLNTAVSSVSFTTATSANEPNLRIHNTIDTSINEVMHNRGQQAPGVHHQLPIMNTINNNRTNNLRSLRDNNRNNCVDLNDEEIDEIHRINANPNNVGPVTCSPGFRNPHQERKLHPLQRGTNPLAKGTFDSIQVCTSDTVEKDKCQCHLVQQHKHQSQLLTHVPQREQAHQRHHHHQQQTHRHKLSQQRVQQQQQQQQQSQQQQQQIYRHHHYHHPHQHIGQQQELRRAQSDETSSRKQMSSSGQDEESDDVIGTSLGSHQPPALPPRPPPRPNRRYEQNSTAAYDPGPNNNDDGGCCKKYVVLCCLCGGLSAAVGSLFLAVHAVLSAHTASLALFETVPSYIPGTMLILMGLFTILLARRKHRYGFLMKMCGSVGVVCALVCVLVTVTTTVVHMSRLQGLRECIYTERARSCTCYGSTQGRISSDPGVLFEETPHCEAVHGALYDCLRALFGVSVAGILACIFSCMLLYQLLSHEKKKMYWEQLQLRCRSLYGQGGSGAVGGPTGGSCGCCNDCGGASPWWAQTPGNLYTPNPDLAPFRRWRLPWSRSRGPAPTPDSNYGFHGQSRNTVVMRSSGSSSGEPGDNTPGPYSVLTDESQTGGGSSGAPYSLINSTSSAPYAACASSVASYSLLENGPVSALWGPPPPYSDPNSPARRPQLNDERRPPVTLRSPTTNPASGTPINLSTNRISNAKRTMDNFEPANCEEYRQQRSMNMRPSDNYENTEEVLSSSTDADMEMGSLHHRGNHHSQRQQDDEGAKSRRTRKTLKGVENGGFQQETANASLTKQSESELYFGDVSSCCGPESSFYDLAVDKEEEQSGQIDPTDSLIDYPNCNRFSKQRQSSKRSRQQQPLPTSIIPEGSVDTMTENYSPLNNPPMIDDLSRSSSTRGPYLAPDAQYEVIAQQTRYTYYNPINGEHVLDIQQRCSSLASLAYRNGNSNNETIDGDQLDGNTSAIDYPSERLGLEHSSGNNRGNAVTPIAKSPTPSSVVVSSPPSSPMSHVSNAVQRCTNNISGNSRESVWPTDHQTRATEGVCPVNV